MIRCGFIILLFVYGPVCTAQLTTDSPTKEYIDSFPANSENFLQAYTIFYPGAAFNIHDSYKTLLKKNLILFAKKAGPASGILNLLSGNYLDHDTPYQVNKIKEKRLDSFYTHTNRNLTALFAKFLDAYHRVPGQTRKMTAYEHAEENYAHRKKILRQWFNPITEELLKLEEYFIKTGLDKALYDSSHQYHVQLLEIKGYIIDRIMELHRYAAAIDEDAARIIDKSKRNSAAVKAIY
jgi:hypothetical protein